MASIDVLSHIFGPRVGCAAVGTAIGGVKDGAGASGAWARHDSDVGDTKADS